MLPVWWTFPPQACAVCGELVAQADAVVATVGPHSRWVHPDCRP